MKCVLMNKNTEILVAEYNEEYNEFDEVYDYLNVKYAPYALGINTNDFDKILCTMNLNDWFKDRGIPIWRDKIDKLLNKLHVDKPDDLLNKAYGLSLSDQYWIKPYGSSLKYDDVNFFDNDFNFIAFLDASFGVDKKVIINEESLETPNNTTDGMVTKAWIIENGNRYLLKSAYKNEVMQPFNEMLATMISSRLGFSYVPYTIDMYKNKVYSKCSCFINKDTELVTAYQVMKREGKFGDIRDYENYIRVLEEHNIENAREKVENMFILDYLIMNEDRHLNNFGIIRDVNTMEWLDVAPIFDNGQCLNVEVNENNQISVLGYGRIFYEISPFDDIISIVNNLDRIDLSRLDGLAIEYKNLLYQYKDIAGLDERVINAQCFLLQRQIDKLKKLTLSNEKGKTR